MSADDDNHEPILYKARIDRVTFGYGSTRTATYVLSALALIDVDDDGEPIPEDNDDDGGDEAIEDNRDEEEIDRPKKKARTATTAGRSWDREPRVYAHDQGHVPLAHVGATLVLWLAPRGQPASAEETPHYDIRGCVKYTPAAASVSRAVLARAICSGGVLCRARLTRLAEAATVGSGRVKAPDAPLAAAHTALVRQLIDRQKKSPVSSLDLGVLLGPPVQHSAIVAEIQRSFESMFLLRDALVGDRLAAAIKALLPVTGAFTDAVVRRCSLRQLEEFAARVKKLSPVDCLFIDALVDPAESDSVEPLALQCERPIERFASGFVRADLDEPCSALVEKFDAEARAQLPQVRTAYALHRRIAGRALFGNTVWEVNGNDDAVDWLVVNEYWKLYVGDPSLAVDPASGVRLVTTPALLGRAKRIRVLLRSFFRHLSVVAIDGGCVSVRPSDLAPLLPSAGIGVVVAPNDAALARAERTLAAAEELACVRLARLTLPELMAREETARVALDHAKSVLLIDVHLLTEADLENCLASMSSMHSKKRVPLELTLLGDRSTFAGLGWAAGSAFADVAASGIVMCDQLYPRDDQTPEDEHPMRTAALRARFAANGAQAIAQMLVGARARTTAAIAVNWHSKPAQWLVLGNTTELLGKGIGVLAAALARRIRDNAFPVLADYDRCVADQKMLTLFARSPGIVQAVVPLSAPFVVFRGAVWRVAQFYRLVRQEPRTTSAKVGEHIKAINSVDTTHVSLDTPGLFIELADDSVSVADEQCDSSGTRFNHCICCQTGAPRIMRVSRHRNELRAGTFMLARDAARGVSQLASRVALVVPEQRAFAEARWSDLCAPLVGLDPRTVVTLVTGVGVGNDHDVTASLAAIANFQARKPRTLLSHALASN
jgi:hypothetical protein